MQARTRAQVSRGARERCCVYGDAHTRVRARVPRGAHVLNCGARLPAYVAEVSVARENERVFPPRRKKGISLASRVCARARMRVMMNKKQMEKERERERGIRDAHRNYVNALVSAGKRRKERAVHNFICIYYVYITRAWE